MIKIEVPKNKKFLIGFPKNNFGKIFLWGGTGLVMLVGVILVYSLLVSKTEVSVLAEEKKANQPISEEVDQNLRIIFVGDLMLSRAIGNLMSQRNDWCFPFLEITDFLKEADLTFGNLEGPISDRGIKVGSIYSFRADPRAVAGLTFAGFDILSIANNHLWDYGAEAFADTLKILEENNINYIGGGSSYEEAHTPVVKEVDGTKIAFLGYTDLVPSFLGRKETQWAVAFPEREQMVLDIQKAKNLADFVVVSLHWGEEYATQHNSSQENLAQFAIEAGADLIIGHHPHAIQEVEKYKEGYIAFSLGNFVFDQNFSEETQSGLLLEVVLKNKKIEKINKHQIKFNSSFQPFIWLPS